MGRYSRFDLALPDTRDVVLTRLPQSPERYANLVSERPSPSGFEIGISGRRDVIQLGKFGVPANCDFVRVASLTAIEARALGGRCIAQYAGHGRQHEQSNIRTHGGPGTTGLPTILSDRAIFYPLAFSAIDFTQSDRRQPFLAVLSETDVEVCPSPPPSAGLNKLPARRTNRARRGGLGSGFEK